MLFKSLQSISTVSKSTNSSIVNNSSSTLKTSNNEVALLNLQLDANLIHPVDILFLNANIMI